MDIIDSESSDEELILLWLLREQRRVRRQRRRWWVHPLNQIRPQQGAYNNLVAEMREDPEKFFNFRRLTCQQFDVLLGKIEHAIRKEYFLREPLSPGLRLSLTLRYVASGDSMVSLSYLYRVGKSTVTGIIKEVTQVIWEVLQPEVLPALTTETLTRIGHDFEETWNFPNCIGAIDGKHVVCQCPKNTGSQYFNYKGTFSIVLMALCDAQYRFTYVSVGSAGKESDGGIFQSSSLQEMLEVGTLRLPPPRNPVGSDALLPPVIVGDAAFPLKPYLMRPYPGTNLPSEKDIFNYRLSRTRVIENTFGVLAARMRIFRKPIIADVATIKFVVQCCVVLHNWLRDHELNIPAGQRRYQPVGFVDRIDRNGTLERGTWRDEEPPQGLRNVRRAGAHNATNAAKEIRREFTRHFMEEGNVAWQWNKLPAHVRDFYRTRAENL